jgi:hypothetical protein
MMVPFRLLQSESGRPSGRTSLALLVGTAVVALVASCSGIPSPTGTDATPHVHESATSPSIIAFAHCMRSHGVPKFPDPDSGGTLPKTNVQQLDVSNSQYRPAAAVDERHAAIQQVHAISWSVGLERPSATMDALHHMTSVQHSR